MPMMGTNRHSAAGAVPGALRECRDSRGRVHVLDCSGMDAETLGIVGDPDTLAVLMDSIQDVEKGRLVEFDSWAEGR